MMWEWIVLVGLALAAVVLLVVLTRVRALAARQVSEAIEETRRLQQRLDRLEQQLPGTTTGEDPHGRGYRITGLVLDPDSLRPPDSTSGPTSSPAPVRLERTVFADVLLRESMIRLGSLAYGVRRAMSPEARNRIRFEMKREVKRSRKERRAEQREAYREWQARQRDRLAGDDLRDSA